MTCVEDNGRSRLHKLCTSVEILPHKNIKITKFQYMRNKSFKCFYNMMCKNFNVYVNHSVKF